MPTKIKTISFQGQNIHIGIDVHLKSWKVSIILDTMEYKTYSQDPDEDILTGYLHRNFPAYEAGFCCFSLHWKLKNAGIKTLLSIRQISRPLTMPGNKRKTGAIYRKLTDH